MNYLWAGMLLVGIVYGCLTGKTAEITQAALDSAGEAISLCITMTGIMCFWVGMMRIAEKAGMIRKMAAKMEPVLHFLFPDLRHETRAKEYIATNMIANIFGLGWAATPAGLESYGGAGSWVCAPDGGKPDGHKGYVYFPGYQHFLSPADTGQYDRIPEPCTVPRIPRRLWGRPSSPPVSAPWWR